MENLISDLKKSCEDLELIIELTNKYKDNNIVSDMLFHKKLEDGILSKLNTANLKQLEIMKHSYKFKYYSRDITNKLIDIAILNVTRKNKIKQLNII